MVINFINKEFHRLIMRKYALVPWQRREFPILFYLNYLLPGVNPIPSQPRNQVYHFTNHIYLKFDIPISFSPTSIISSYHGSLERIHSQPHITAAQRQIAGEISHPVYFHPQVMKTETGNHPAVKQDFMPLRHTLSRNSRDFTHARGLNLHHIENILPLLIKKEESALLPSFIISTGKKMPALLSHQNRETIPPVQAIKDRYAVERFFSSLPAKILSHGFRVTPGEETFTFLKKKRQDTFILERVRRNRFIETRAEYFPNQSTGKSLELFPTPGTMNIDNEKHHTPLLTHFFPQQFAGLKKTYQSQSNRESPVSEEPTNKTIKTGDQYIYPGGQGVPDQFEKKIDLPHLTDQVYRLLERKIRVEKEMRGW